MGDKGSTDCLVELGGLRPLAVGFVLSVTGSSRPEWPLCFPGSEVCLEPGVGSLCRRAQVEWVLDLRSSAPLWGAPLRLPLCFNCVGAPGASDPGLS